MISDIVYAFLILFYFFVLALITNSKIARTVIYGNKSILERFLLCYVQIFVEEKIFI